MNFKQCELSLNSASKKTIAEGRSRTGQSREALAKSIYRTTKQVVEFLGLDSDYLLLKARSNGSIYRSDRYIVVPAGRNKWELFKLCRS